MFVGSLVSSALTSTQTTQIETAARRQPVASIAALKALTPSAGDAVNVLGYYAAGDGGGGAFYYDAAASAADNGGTIIAPTAGSGRWLRVYSGPINARWFGAKFDGTTDDTAAIQAALNNGSTVLMPPGDSVISDSLSIPSICTITGSGQDQTKITGSGMAGKSAIKFADTEKFARVSISGFRLTGDFDRALDLTVGAAFFLYNSHIRDLYLSSASGAALYAPIEFSTLIENVSAGSTNDNGFEISGNVATTLVNCYATSCGAGKAGYRIYEQALMVGCNGINTGPYWGCFGQATAADGTNRSWIVTMIGCNLEDFTTAAIEIRYTGRLSMQGCSFVPPSSGTFVTLIDGRNHATDGYRVYENQCSYASKGSTMSGNSRIMSKGLPNNIYSVSGVFSDLYRSDQSLLYSITSTSLSNPAYLKLAVRYSAIDFERAYGFVLQPPSTWTANASTFAVTRLSAVKTANTAPTNLDYASGGELGQRLSVIVQDANTTIRHNQSYSGRFLNKSGADIAAANGDVLYYIHNGTNWSQIA